MKLLKTLGLAVLLPLSYGISAQGTPVPATDDTMMDNTMEIEDVDAQMMEGKKQGSMFEFGIRPSYSWVAGDVNATGGYGLGIHFRKAFDHVFSVRLDGLYAANSGDERTGGIGNRRFESRWSSGTVFGVVTLNNIKYEGDRRNTNIYAMLGGGGHVFRAASQAPGATNFDEDDPLGDNSRNDIVERDLRFHYAVGTGVAFRISPRFNIGLEYQAYIPLGDMVDQLDGYNRGDFRDVQNNASVNLNFNIGNAATQLEPRYWENPFNPVKSDIMDVRNKVDAATMDSDGDGVVDAIDQEANTPSGAPVDTKGRMLDSDGDGVPDYKDLEPFFPPRAGEVVDANGVITNRADKPITEDRIQQMIDASIARINVAGPTTTSVTTTTGAMYLPIIYFPLNQSTVKYADYGTLSSVARVMEGNPGMRIVVRGYTDKTGTDGYNQRLSYQRAQNVISHLVNQHGISRDRFILQYRGESDPLVPQNQTVVNRRVEFLNATAGEREDPAPAGAGGRGY